MTSVTCTDTSGDLKRVRYLEVAEVDHAIHHLTDTEAVAEVVKRVVTVVLLNCQLEPREKINSLSG